MTHEVDGAIGEETVRCAEVAVAWQEVDRALRGIAARRAGLDAEEARWLREAEVLQIWKPLGMVSAIDYMDRVLGYAPRKAQERLRVARALGGLSALEDALVCGALTFGAVRELTRVATVATELAWRDAAIGKTVRQIEELVADHRPGDGPTDPKDPTARTHVVRFELSAETFARLRQTRQAVDEESGSRVSDDALVAALCEGALGAGAAGAFDGRAKFQVAVTVCERCRQGWQNGAGVTVAIEPPAVDRALCDAQHIGSLDGAAPERAYQDIAPSVARFVWRRDGGRCRVPGCRSARGLELHHIVHREEGGQHDALNLALLCSACHTAHHRGALRISGTAAELDVVRVATTTPAASKLDDAIHRARTPGGAHVGAEIGIRCAGVACAHVNAGGAPEDTGNRAGVDGAHVGARGASEDIGGALEDTGAQAGVDGANVGVVTDGAIEDITRAGVDGAHVGVVTGGAIEDITRAGVDGAHVGAAIGGGGESIGNMHARVGGVHAGVASQGEGRPSGPVRQVNEVRTRHTTPARLTRQTTPANGGNHAGSNGADRDRAEMVGLARDALVGLGWSAGVSRAAVAAAATMLGDAVTLERLVFEAFRHCPRPRTMA